MALHAAVVEQPAAEPIRSSAALDRPEADIPAVQSEPVAAGSTGMAHADAQTEAAPAGEAPAARGSQPSTEAETTEDLAPDHSAAPGAETEEASLYIPRGAMPPPLRGSLESLERQNEKLTSEGLERIEDEDDLAARIADGLLVPVPASGSLVVNGNLPLNHRYCRPWTAHFLADLAEAHDAVFHRPLEVSSAVRTVAYQKRLMRVNGNAAPAEGDIVSPHLTGATVDIAKEGMTRAEMGWMRNRLMALEAEGKIDVEEEFHQRCFHITVYTSYAPHAVHRVTPSRAQTPPDSPKDPDTKPEVTGDVATQGQ